MAAPIDATGISAIIAASCTGVAAIIAAIGLQIRASKKFKTADPALEERAPLPPVPESGDPGELVEFMKVLRADNVDLRERDKVKDKKIDGLQTDLDAMSVELRMALKIQEAFMRWIPVIFSLWGKSERPPLPEGEDLITLQEFIPRG